MVFSAPRLLRPLPATWLVFMMGIGIGPAVGQPLPAPAPTVDAQRTSEGFAAIDSLRKAQAFREALRRLHSMKTKNPDDVGVHYRLAVLWSDLGKDATDLHRTLSFYRQSLSAAETAVEVDSTSGWAHLAVALAQGRLTLHASTRERVDRSRAVKAHADRAVALDSTLAGAYHIRGRWHREAASLNVVERTVVRVVYGGLPDASYEQAVADFQRALELETRTYHHLELGKTYLEMDRLDAARAQWQAALEASPVDPFAPEYKAEARALLEEHS
jgi:tetratricopeptide (TPR) repeat protein